MILGHEYVILSEVPGFFKLHEDGYYKFTESYFINSEEEDFTKELLDKLSVKGIVKKESQLVYLSTHKWIDIFVKSLNQKCLELRLNIRCDFIEKKGLKGLTFSLIDQSDQYSKIIDINFNPDNIESTEGTINFCVLRTTKFNIFWLDLLNDTNILRYFASYVKGEVESLIFSDRIKFDFFDGIDKLDYTTIFNSTIPDFYKEEGYNVKTISSSYGQLTKKFLRNDNFDCYELHSHGNVVSLVISIQNSIHFFSFKGDRVVKDDNFTEITSKLKEKLLKKVEEYNEILLFNKIKVLNTTQSTLKLFLIAFGLIGAPINVIVTGIHEFHNKVITYLLGIGSLLIVIFLFIFILVPAIKVSKFNWKL